MTDRTPQQMTARTPAGDGMSKPLRPYLRLVRDDDGITWLQLQAVSGLLALVRLEMPPVGTIQARAVEDVLREQAEQ